MATFDQRGQTVGVQQNADQITNVYAAPASTLSRHDLELIARAVDDETLPIPLVFNLTSWGRVPGSFDDWLVQEHVAKHEHELLTPVRSLPGETERVDRG